MPSSVTMRKTKRSRKLRTSSFGQMADIATRAGWMSEALVVRARFSVERGGYVLC
jgi:hypothetical protein